MNLQVRGLDLKGLRFWGVLRVCRGLGLWVLGFWVYGIRGALNWRLLIQHHVKLVGLKTQSLS